MRTTQRKTHTYYVCMNPLLSSSLQSSHKKRLCSATVKKTEMSYTHKPTSLSHTYTPCTHCIWVDTKPNLHRFETFNSHKTWPWQPYHQWGETSMCQQQWTEKMDQSTKKWIWKNVSIKYSLMMMKTLGPQSIIKMTFLVPEKTTDTNNRYKKHIKKTRHNYSIP